MKTLKICILTIFCIAMALPAVANDGTYYTRGNQLIPLQETDISVRKEVLTISLMDNGFARVDVQYEFWNPGVAKTVTMGIEARKDIEEFTGKRCFLSLHVKVLKDWRNSDRALKSFGYALED